MSDSKQIIEICEGQVWECNNGEICGILEVKDGFIYASSPGGVIRMMTNLGEHSDEYDLKKIVRSYSGTGVKVNQTPALKMQMIGRASRVKPETCRKMQALRAVYGYLHCEPFTSEDLVSCKHIIKEVLND